MSGRRRGINLNTSIPVSVAQRHVPQPQIQPQPQPQPPPPPPPPPPPMPPMHYDYPYTRQDLHFPPAPPPPQFYATSAPRIPSSAYYASAYATHNRPGPPPSSVQNPLIPISPPLPSPSSTPTPFDQILSLLKTQAEATIIGFSKLNTTVSDLTAEFKTVKDEVALNHTKLAAVSDDSVARTTRSTAFFEKTYVTQQVAQRSLEARISALEKQIGVGARSGTKSISDRLDSISHTVDALSERVRDPDAQMDEDAPLRLNAALASVINEKIYADVCVGPDPSDPVLNYAETGTSPEPIIHYDTAVSPRTPPPETPRRSIATSPVRAAYTEVGVHQTPKPSPPIAVRHEFATSPIKTCHHDTGTDCKTPESVLNPFSISSNFNTTRFSAAGSRRSSDVVTFVNEDRLPSDKPWPKLTLSPSICHYQAEESDEPDEEDEEDELEEDNDMETTPATTLSVPDIPSPVNELPKVMEPETAPTHENQNTISIQEMDVDNSFNPSLDKLSVPMDQIIAQSLSRKRTPEPVSPSPASVYQTPDMHIPPPSNASPTKTIHAKDIHDLSTPDVPATSVATPTPAVSRTPMVSDSEEESLSVTKLVTADSFSSVRKEQSPPAPARSPSATPRRAPPPPLPEPQQQLTEVEAIVPFLPQDYFAPGGYDQEQHSAVDIHLLFSPFVDAVRTPRAERSVSPLPITSAIYHDQTDSIETAMDASLPEQSIESNIESFRFSSPIEIISFQNKPSRSPSIRVDSSPISSFLPTAGPSRVRTEPKGKTPVRLGGAGSVSRAKTSPVIVTGSINNSARRILPPAPKITAVQLSPIYISSSRSPSPLTSVPGESGSDAESDASDLVRIVPPKKKRIFKREDYGKGKRKEGEGEEGENGSPVAKKRKSILNVRAVSGTQSTATTRVKKRKMRASETMTTGEPPLKRARERASVEMGGSVSAPVVGHKKNSEKDASMSLTPAQSQSKPKPKPKGKRWPAKTKLGDDVFQRALIECKWCFVWYHYGCVGIVPGDPRIEFGDGFKCPSCEGKGANLLVPKINDRCGRPRCFYADTDDTPAGFYVVTAILGRVTIIEGGRGKRYIWLLQWDGYPLSASTWEEESSMSEPAVMIETFLERAEKEGVPGFDDPDKFIMLKEAREAGLKAPS